MISEYAVYMTGAAHHDVAEIMQYVAEGLAERIFRIRKTRICSGDAGNAWSLHDGKSNG